MSKLLNKIALLAILLVVFAFVFQGCIKDKFDMSKIKFDNQQAFAFPIADTELDVYDLLAYVDTSDLVELNGDTLALIYEGELFSMVAEDVLTIPNQTETQSYSSLIPATPVLPAGQSGPFPQSYNFPMNIAAGFSVDSISIKSGTWSVDITNQYSHVLKIRVMVPTLVENGNSFDNTITVQPNSSTSQVFDLSNYTLSLSNNDIVVNYEITLISDGLSGVSGTETVTTNIQINDLKYKRVYGDFGTQTLTSDQDSILIRIFKNTSSGYFEFIDPKLKITVDNSFGFPLDVTMNRLEAINYNQNQLNQVTEIQYGNPMVSAPYSLLTIAAPASLGATSSSSLVMDNTNSTIAALTTSTSKYLYHQGTPMLLPPDFPNSQDYNYHYISDDSELKLTTQVELPLDGLVKDWGLSDTIDLNFSMDKIFGGEGSLEKFILKIDVQNGFPFDAYLTLTGLDDNYQPLSVLLDEQLIKTAITDANGVVIEPGQQFTEITCETACLQDLATAKYLKIEAAANTENANSNKAVKIFADYKFGLKMGNNMFQK